MIQQLVSNWVCWAIAITALVCYQQLWAAYFEENSFEENSFEENNFDDSSFEDQSVDADGGLDAGGRQQDTRHNFCSVLIGALPLLGLLGTIIGLLGCFTGMAQQGADSEQLSEGIADALLTTQLGLVCAIPAWLLQGFIRSRQHVLAAIEAK